MEMSVDNIIYIVVTIVIIIVSMLGQTKKKKLQTPMTHEEDDTVYSLNDFEKILERKKEFKQKEEFQDIIESETPAKTENQTELKGNEKKKKLVEENDNNDGFDVKSAIIYSSILERKKFRR